jgi:membrane-associated protein
MEFLTTFIDIVLHLDKHLEILIQNYGTLVYVILFAIIFCETGLVVTPFLPGDSLLFVAGTLAAIGNLEVHLLAPMLMLAAFLGDNTNYWIGRFLGPKVFKNENAKILNKKHLVTTQQFYEKHGGKMILFARFLPIIRTFAPFVAGIGKMHYRHFVPYSLAGNIFWVSFFTYGGYYFGNIPFVKNNLSYFIVAIVLISITPGAIGYLRQRCAKKNPV